MIKEELITISIQENGAYFIYKIPNVKRGIRGKNKGNVNELIIVGVPIDKLEQYCKKENITLEAYVPTCQP